MLNSAPIIHRRGFMFVLSSPSGAGKTTLSRLLLGKDSNLTLSISTTTRPKRPNEEEGVDYFFTTKEEFKEMASNKEFLEHAEVFDHLYGTPRKKVYEALEAGTDVLFDIDWQGTEQLAANCREDLVSIFILPPSMAELENRLRKRAQDSEEVIQGRMAKANREISHWYAYDYVIVNYDIDDSLRQVSDILHAERKKRIRQHGLEDFINNLLSQNE